MGVWPQADIFQAEIALDHRPRCGCTGSVLDAARHEPTEGLALEGHEVAIFEVNQGLGDLQEGRGIRCQIGLLWCLPLANEQRRTKPGGHKRAGIQGADGSKGIGPLQAASNGSQCAGQVVRDKTALMQEVGDDLRVGLGCKGVSGSLKVLPEDVMIFNDAVVDHAHLEPAPRREVRMGVVLCHGPMGGPTGVGNAQVCGMPCTGGCELCHSANRSDPREGGAVKKRQASRVVSAIFQLTKALD